MPHQKHKPLDPKKALISGAIWAVAMRWSVKSIGLVSTAILARQLAPQDYGIVGMAFLVVEMVSTFLDTGASAALVRIGNPTKAQIDSAWTLRGLQGLLIAIILLALSPLAAAYFNEPRVSNVLYVVSICVALMGFSNIGMTLAYKDLMYSLEYRVAIITKVAGVATTLGAALVFKDYRALVFGIVAGYVVEFSLSYAMHPYRPSWNTTKLREIWGVSKWLMLTGIGGFLLGKVDRLIAGRIATTQGFGLYTVGSDIGQLPAGEIGPSMVRAFFPILAAIKHDLTRARQATLKTLSTVNTITMPLGVGLAAVSVPATVVLLGPTWIEAAPFVAGFALISTIKFSISPINTLLNVCGFVKEQSFIMWTEFFVFASLALALSSTYQLQGLIYSRIASSLVHVVLMAWLAKNRLDVSLGSMVQVTVRPLIGVVLMYLMIDHLPDVSASIFIQLIFSIGLGIIFFTAWIFATWLIVKKPDGVETLLVSHIKNGFSKK